MPQFRQSKEVYASCQKDGYLIQQEEVDKVKITHMIAIALGDLEGIQMLIKNTSKESPIWSTIYKLIYDALHQFVEAFVRLDRIKSGNHQCLFAHLCEKHPELELDWSFLEKVRTKRNGIQYY